MRTCQAGNGVEALTTIDRLQPDVVFLDVQMPGLTGFEVARRLLGSRAASQIIFVTAYDQHAIEAFEVNAVDYLLKPVDQARLEVAVDRARRRISADGRWSRGRTSTAPSWRRSGRGSRRTAEPAGAPGDRCRGAPYNRRYYLRLYWADKDYGRMSQHWNVGNYRTLDELHDGPDASVFWRVIDVTCIKIKEIVPRFSRTILHERREARRRSLSAARTRRLREHLKL